MDTPTQTTTPVALDTRVDGAAQATPTSEPTATPDFSGLDLTTIPQVRELQSKLDRQVFEANRRAAEADRRLQQLEAQRQQDLSAQRQRDMEAIQSLDPQEQAVQLRRQLQQVEQERQADQLRTAFNGQIRQIVSEGGATWDDPRLDAAKAYGDTPQGVLAMSQAVARISREEAEAAKLALKKAQEDAGRGATTAAAQARTSALVDAGATATSSASPVLKPTDERADSVLRFKKRFGDMKSSGVGTDSPEYRKFVSDMRTAKVWWNDLGY